MDINFPPIQEKTTEQNGFFPQVWVRWFSSIKNFLDNKFRADGSFIPASLADADAANNSVYYSTTQAKLVYKDASGTVRDLY